MTEEEIHALCLALAPMIRAEVDEAVRPLTRKIDVLRDRLGNSLLSVDEAAAYAGCSRRTIYRRVEAGALIPSTPPGRDMKFSVDALDIAVDAGIL